MQNTAIVIQTCDKYRFLWESWRYYFIKYWDFLIPSNIYFCTEEELYPTHMKTVGRIINIRTGKGRWGKRLHRILDALPRDIDTIFYMQEDFWLHRTLPKHVFESRLKTFLDWDMDAYRCCAPSKHFKFIGKYPPYLFSQDSPYLITHQASFWKKDFFRSCVLPHEDPWENEKKGTKRLLDKEHAIYFAPFNFYHTVCCKGELTELGRQLDAQAQNDTD